MLVWNVLVGMGLAARSRSLMNGCVIGWWLGFADMADFLLGGSSLKAKGGICWKR